MRNMFLAALIATGPSLVGSSIGLAADMPLKAPSTVASPAYLWTGFYAGVNAGYGRNRHDAEFTGEDPVNIAGYRMLNWVFSNISSPDLNSYSQALDADGFVGGGQIGFNWQFAGRWVAGIEADLQYSGLESETSTPGGPNSTLYVTILTNQETKWFGTVRGRLGLLASERLLVFGTAGLAYGKTDVKASATAETAGLLFGTIPTQYLNCIGGHTVCVAGSESKTSIGWTAGAGVEWAVLNNISIKVEYLHVDLGDQTLRLVAQSPSSGNGWVTAKFDNSFDIVRAGLNVRF